MVIIILNVLSKQHGFTLIEIAVAMVILGIVTSVVGSYFVFNAKLLDKVSSRWSAQSDNSLAAKFITEQVRNATELELIGTAAAPAPGYNYIYLDSAANTVQYIGIDGAARNITTAPISSLSFALKKDAMGHNFLKFIIRADAGRGEVRTYETTSEVALNNVSGLEPATGTVLCYKLAPQ
jgi:prepilin-type N-terminal cleavage/methylation domain-containing protein